MYMYWHSKTFTWKRDPLWNTNIYRLVTQETAIGGMADMCVIFKHWSDQCLKITHPIYKLYKIRTLLLLWNIAVLVRNASCKWLRYCFCPAMSCRIASCRQESLLSLPGSVTES